MTASDLFQFVGLKCSVTHDNGIGVVAVHGFITDVDVAVLGEPFIVVETRTPNGLTRSKHRIPISKITNVVAFKHQPTGGATK